MNRLATGAIVGVVGLVAAVFVARSGEPRPRRYRLAEALMIAGTVPWIYLILLPGVHHAVYLIPFTDLAEQFRVGLRFAAWQIGGNLLVFAAFGFGAPIRWRIGPLTVLATAAATSACLEFIQYAMAAGRVASIDDVLVNTVGAGLAAACSRPWWRRRAREGSTLSSPAGTFSQR